MFFVEALELCVEGRRVKHSWFMCVISHSYGWLDGCRNGGGYWYACVTKPGWVGRMSGDA